MARKYKRLVVISDLHCGAFTGLTHPGFDSDKYLSKHYNLYNKRRALWDWYVETIESLKPIDVLLVNGDCVDGKGPRSGGTELLTTDRDEQVEMAVQAIRYAKAKTIVMSYGTPYHVGTDEDWEDAIARELQAQKIGGEDSVSINNWIVNYRHHIGGSSIPHGRHTAVAKEALWNTLWSLREEYPLADLIIRSHVHYFGYAGSYNQLYLTTPALSTYGSKFGARKMSGTVDIGMLEFLFPDKEKGEPYKWTPYILRFPKQEPIAV